MAGAIFVVSDLGSGQQGPVAGLVSTAGWAEAARRVLGESWIVTPRGVLDPGDARKQGSSPTRSNNGAPTARRHVPETVKTGVKDVRRWWRGRSYRVEAAGPWRPEDIRFVWQRHGLFEDAGLRLATALGVPSVLFVPATGVWEAERWGTHRPGWGPWLERHAERPALQAADLIACGTEAVAEQALRLGAPEARILITPTGVDLGLFSAEVDAAARRRALGVDGRFVVGWVGSFRRFHAIEQAVDAVAALDGGASLLMVGDGQERSRIEARARDRGVHAVFTGTVEHQDLPTYLAAMDVALVLAPTEGEFHYSPLKLAEYLAAGLPVVAPAVGQVRERLTDGVDALLVEPNDQAGLLGALGRLRDDPALRDRIARVGRDAAVAHWSWDHQISRVLDALA